MGAASTNTLERHFWYQLYTDLETIRGELTHRSQFKSGSWHELELDQNSNAAAQRLQIDCHAARTTESPFNSKVMGAEGNRKIADQIARSY
tara:strand:- start:573 stop:845 length:273 start_codon:yes stop_codon:yes gene_type:complete